MGARCPPEMEKDLRHYFKGLKREMASAASRGETAYSDAQNHSTNSNDTRKESYKQAAQTPALTEGRDDPGNPTVAEPPGLSRELIVMSPHVMSEGKNATSSQSGDSTPTLLQRIQTLSSLAIPDRSWSVPAFCFAPTVG
ncbi:uncharacterized protein IUM83_02027 [Phytophthora cinnamomi]|uniref:uncharacterized protein n=1 Tax=Phytophthora cinnamomi TaxID=4785 RepID=UPI00355A3228|nr:hypothetical protein IUM83_02027 [Phytophthora cinnamomi]